MCVSVIVHKMFQEYQGVLCYDLEQGLEATSRLVLCMRIHTRGWHAIS